MKKLLLVLMSAAALFAQPYNTTLQSDTVWVTSSATAYSRIFFQDNVSNKSLVIQMDDTSAAYISNDSACVSVELKQVFTDQFGNRNKYAYVFPSHAFPDSTNYYGSDNFMLWDSLNITSMDTTTLWAKAGVPIISIFGDTSGYKYVDGLDSVLVGANRIAAAYRTLTPDWSPGIVFKFIGNAIANKRASAVRIILHYWQLMSTK